MADEEKMIVTDATKPTRRRPFLYRYYPSTSASGRNALSGLLLAILLIGITVLILYLVYRPSHPRFSVSTASLLSLTPSPNSRPTVVSTTLQFTLNSHNPSDRTIILYDRLSAYAAYRNEPVTPPVPLPPLVQETDSTVSVSPVVGGEYVPVSAEAAQGLVTDQGYGAVALRLVLTGRVKYRSGPFRSGWHGLYVGCNVLIGVRNGLGGQTPLLGEPRCNVHA